MKINSYEIPHSSFLSVEKDMNLIIDKFLKNDRLKKLLYYPTKDCLSRPNLTEEQTLSLIDNQIRIVPKLQVDENVKTYVILSFDHFQPNANNPEFRDNLIEFDIICHFDQWKMQDFELRPYKIAGEIDSMFNNKHLTGIGETQFLSANQLLLSPELAGICLMYEAIHGGEDKEKMPNPNKEQDFIEDFNRLFNGKN